MGLEQTIELTGDLKLMAQLDELKTSAVNAVMGPAISKGLTPVNKEAKRRAKLQFKSNYISKMIAKKVKRGRKGVVGMIYVRDDRQGRTIKVKGRDVDFKVAAMIQEFGRRDGTLKPRPFMRPAMASMKGKALAIIKKEARQNLKKVIKKAKAKGRRIKRG